MRRRFLSWRPLGFAGVIAASALVPAWYWLARDEPPDPLLGIPVHVDQVQGEPLQPIAAPAGLDERKVELGRRLFNDARLSEGGAQACASCHRPEHGGADDAAFSRGAGGEPVSIHTPTVWNSAFNVAQFWDGRAVTLEEQVDGPLLSPAEMATTWPAVLSRLQQDRGYVADMLAIYGTRTIAAEFVRDAIATYERSLVSSGSRFDAFLLGDDTALTPEEQRGYRLFKEYGCAACHQGAAVGGNIFQRFGLFADYFAERGGVTAADLGRYNVTRREEDRYVFKVPSLREAARTPPYLHDGSAATLEDAISIMARYQLGRTIPSEEVALIAAFIGSLGAAELQR